MSIKSITIGNFKGIRDKARVELRPITLLYGPNSGGKSTIVQAIHYAREVMLRHNLDPNFTELGGTEIDLGGFENMVYAHDKTRPISLRFDMDLRGKELPQYFEPECVYTIKVNDGLDDYYIAWWNILPSDMSSAWVELEISWDKSTDTYLVSRYEVGLNDQLIVRVQTSGAHNTPRIQYINFLHPLLTKNQAKIIRKALKKILRGEAKEHGYDRAYYFKELVDKFIEEPEKWFDQLDPKVFPREVYCRLSEFVDKYKPYKVELSENLKKLSKVLKVDLDSFPGGAEEWKRHRERLVRKFIESAEKVEELANECGVNPSDFYAPLAPCYFLFSCLDWLGLESISGDLNIPIKQSKTLQDALPDFDDDYGLSIGMSTMNDIGFYYEESLRSAISQIVLGPGKILRDELAKFHYIGPIRARLPRNYEPNRWVENSNWANGIAAWDVLHKEEADFINEVNGWLSERMKTGYQVSRKIYKEIDFSEADSIEDRPERLMKQYALAPIKTRLFLTDQNRGIEVQLPDIGTGISQILPIIVGALYLKAGIVAIEQPELHIHPALQTDIGDLFINSALGSQKNIFLIETHSEHLLLRIMRRMRETASGQLPKEVPSVRPADVMVLFIEPFGPSTIIREMPLNEYGELVKAWPGGFFEEGLREVF